MSPTSRTSLPNERKNPATPGGTGFLRCSAPRAVAARSIFASSVALAAFMACGSDPAAVDDGDDAVSNAAGGSNAGSGSSGSGSSGSGNSGSGDSEVIQTDYSFPECITGDPSEPCSWALSSEFTGTLCTPGAQLILGCCDCGIDPVLLRVCDGNTSCSFDASIGVESYCGLCPLTEFTCPPSGVFSALAGSYPGFSFDEETQEVTTTAAPPSTCQPKLVDVSDSGQGSDTGTVRFDQIHPVLVTSCGRCHAEDTGLGSFLNLPPFASADTELAYTIAADRGISILAQINAGVMPPDTCERVPPGGPGCVSVDDFELIRSWVAAGTPR